MIIPVFIPVPTRTEEDIENEEKLGKIEKIIKGEEEEYHFPEHRQRPERRISYVNDNYSANLDFSLEHVNPKKHSKIEYRVYKKALKKNIDLYLHTLDGDNFDYKDYVEIELNFILPTLKELIENKKVGNYKEIEKIVMGCVNRKELEVAIRKPFSSKPAYNNYFDDYKYHLEWFGEMLKKEGIKKFEPLEKVIAKHSYRDQIHYLKNMISFSDGVKKAREIVDKYRIGSYKEIEEASKAGKIEYEDIIKK